MENNDLGRVGYAEQALVNEAPAGLRPSGFDPSRKFFFSRSEVAGALAMWAVRQSPYPVPDHLDEAVASMFDALPDDNGEWFWATESELQQMVEFVCLNDQTIVSWNKPKSGHTSEIVFSSRYDAPDPDDDIIDLYALSGNIMRTVMAEQYEHLGDAQGMSTRQSEDAASG
jgi:hypothetical protein